MYDIKQFKPALYLVVLIGLTGYALAAQSPGVWVFSVALVMTNIWLVRQGTFRPVPRVLANGVTVLAFAYAFLQVRSHEVDSPILAIGQFLVLLQVVKVWEQRANRDYAQLLVLSLLLMVAAAISTASLLFGLLFVVYLLTSLYCCLLFHLKVETDNARAAQLPTAEPDALASMADRGGTLAASMRRLTGLISAYALVAAVVVFLFFPRGPGAGLFGQFVWKPKDTLTGFSEQVSFQQVAKITQNNEQVGTIRLSRDGNAQQFAGPLLLRGYTDDYYSGGEVTGTSGAYQWSHIPHEAGPGHRMIDNPDSATWHPARETGPTGTFHQDVDLNPTGTPVLFALAGLTQLQIEDPTNARQLRLDYGPDDQTVRASDSITRPIRYAVDSTGELGDGAEPAHPPSVIDPAIHAYALRADVTGGLAARRERDAAARPDGGAGWVSPLDEQVAARIDAHLRHNFQYTLDLTTVEMRGRDPIAAFLTDFKKGHCEYFAGAMTLMCQSLGMQARLVVGFKVDDFNPFGHYYTIRQSQAHAWVEVRTAHGWASFDPTSGNEAAVASASLWQRTKSLFDFMEYTWQRAVISYSADNRDNLIQTMNSRLSTQAYRAPSVMANGRAELERLGDKLASNVVGPLVVLLVCGLLGSIGWFMAERYRLRRRAARIGLDDLPPDAQARLVRQLAFYDGLVRLLGRHHIARPPHLTPMEFSRSLAFLPGNAYDTVRRLTAVFYRIRFGGAAVDDGRQRRLLAVVDRLEGMMPQGANVQR